jgi:endonuclease YncB( thermonuclease family)
MGMVFKGWAPKPPHDPRRGGKRRWWQWRWAGVAAIIGLAVILGLARTASHAAEGETFQCAAPVIVDGDTLRCGSRRVRLSGIDAPELAGHCRRGRECAPGDPHASTSNLRRLVGSAHLKCRQMDIDAYGRTVARCSANGQDLSCGQLDGGFAIRRYAAIQC